ncbi:MAG: efflux RND transporter periplasmic adaptor subunit [Fimbriimonas sp.]|nr:efflux RND transporter periplasmic adaptor subunit [Fimbriimonas sp.]
MNSRVLWSLAGIVALTVTGCVDREAQRQSKATEEVIKNPVKAVTTLPARLDTVSEYVEITGDVTAGEDTTIGSKQTNRVVSVLVKDGDSVSAGQLLALMDDTAPQAQLKQAQAQVATASASLAAARSQLIQAERNATVGPHKSTLQVYYAQSQVRGAQRSLDKLINGTRPEERRQAEANLASAKATLELQKKQLERTRTLVQEGALPGENLDQQQASYDQALAQYKNAGEAVKINEAGSRQEDIDTAKAALQSAQENLRTAEDQKKLDPLLKDQVDAAQAQVDSARAQLASARAQIQIATQAIGDTKVYAPFSGKVSGRPIQAGTVAGANTAIVRIVGGGGIYFSGQITSDNIEKVKSGDPVQVHVDGLTDKVFDGRIVTINPLADSVGRLFSVRVQFLGATDALKPGMFARGSVTVRTIPNAILVPNSSVLSKGDSHYVFTVVGDKAKQVKVSTGLSKGDDIQVTGLTSDARVVVNGQEDLLDGVQVAEKGVKSASLNSSPKTSEGKG